MTKREMVAITKLHGLLEKSELPYAVQTIGCYKHRNLCYCYFFIHVIHDYKWQQFLKNNPNFIGWKIYDVDSAFPKVSTVYVAFPLDKQSKRGLKK
jgi:hypothetical protein